jgi:hypothetical protein
MKILRKKIGIQKLEEACINKIGNRIKGLFRKNLNIM